MQVKRAALQAALSVVRPAIASKSYLPALTHVRFSKGWLTAYDEVIAITTSLLLNEEIAGIEACVPGEQLIATVAQFTGEHLQMDVKDGALTIKHGRSKVKLALLPASDFPFEVPDWPDAAIPMTGALAGALATCAAGAGKDESLPATLGVTLCDDGGRLSAFATDNRTITAVRTGIAWPAHGWRASLLPASFCTAAAAMAERNGHKENLLVCHGDVACADVDSVGQVWTRLMSDFKPLDYVRRIDAICPSELIGRMMPLPDGFDGAVSRAMLITSGEQQPAVTISVEGDVMRMGAEAATGRAQDELTLATPVDEDVEPFRVDPSLLARAAKRCDAFLALPGALALFGDKGTLQVLVAHLAG